MEEELDKEREIERGEGGRVVIVCLQPMDLFLYNKNNGSTYVKC